MSFFITDECIGCGVCLPECPNEAVREREGRFWIRAGLCTECVDDPQGPHCRALCPIEGAVIKNTVHEETLEQLRFKHKRNELRRQFERLDALRQTAENMM